MFNINNFEDTYAGKTILITGHTGFKGSILSVWLTKLGARVVGLSDKYPTDNGGIKWLSNVVDRRYRCAIEYMVDVRDIAQVKYVMNVEKPDFVFHLAAQALVKTAYNDPAYTFQTNVMGTLNVLNAFYECFATASESHALVCITSDKCYQNVEQMWGYRETDRVGGDDPYSASKGCAELIINSYMKSFLPQMPKCGIASVRAGNVIGGGDCSENRLIPDCIRAIANTKDITLRNPNSTRPWLHVFEALSGYMLVGQELYNNQTKFSTNFNFGPKIESNRSVGDVVDLFMSNFDTTSKVYWSQTNIDPNQHECGLLNLDVTKSFKMLDWSSRWDINTTLQHTAEWYRVLLTDDRLSLDITLNQINEYCNY